MTFLLKLELNFKQTKKGWSLTIWFNEAFGYFFSEKLSTKLLLFNN